MARRPTIDWKELAIDSHYKTAAAIKKAIEAGDTDEAALGIGECDRGHVEYQFAGGYRPSEGRNQPADSSH